ncbi:MAG: hypothetical protein ABJF10_08645 [Chthoniobacter sp.]|uniref:hypothetical protein n=1 Tax=Chthoniobacter sp. TaxID=2510640 RepID=UPI0032A9FD1F
MRLLLLLLCGVSVLTSAHGELYLAKESRSPDGTVVFAIIYAPTDQHVEGSPACCFVHPKSKKRIGNIFYLDGVDADTARPGTYIFDHYHLFDYVWSADSTHVAIVYNMRHSSRIYPFRRQGSSFQQLPMPDLVTPLEERLRGTLQQDHNTFTTANRWTRHHRLIATITRNAQVSSSGNESKDWREHSLRSTISFDATGKPHVEAAHFRVQITP